MHVYICIHVNNIVHSAYILHTECSVNIYMISLYCNRYRGSPLIMTHNSDHTRMHTYVYICI